MNKADAVTLFRTFLVFSIVYGILTGFNPWILIAGIILMFVLDAVDGFAAINSASKGRITISKYIRYALGDKDMVAAVSKLKPILKKQSIYGARLDVAGDRITEYAFWLVFMFVGIVPLWLVLALVLRHSFADALMGAKGTSSRMKSGFARMVYGSNAGRFWVGALKALTFSYLVLVHSLGYPLIIGYALITILVIYIMLRGAAEIYESIRS